MRTIKKWMYTFDENMEIILDPLPYYPLFGTWDGNPDNSRIWKPEAQGFPSRVPEKISWLGACRASCYTPDQELLTKSGYVPIKDAADQFVTDIVTLSHDALLENLRFKNSKVGNYTKSFRSTLHDIITIEILSGGTLTVTPNHPVLDSHGFI